MYSSKNLKPLLALLAFAMLLVFIAAPSAGAVSTTLVINEIDYDQDSTDTAEFIEIKNVSAGPINLDGWTLETVNGTGGGATVAYTIPLPNISLAAGDYFVVCGDAAYVANCDLDTTPDTNLIQNGAPDAVGLRDGVGDLIDTVSYEGDTGAPYTEGSGAGLEDDYNNEDAGISRIPDGTDTDVNNVDLDHHCITPGEANTTDTPPCVVIPEVTIPEIQGAGHLSPYEGQTVITTGIVTAVSYDTIYVQDAVGDGDDATSDGISAYMGSGCSSCPAVGDEVQLTDSVSEYIPGGAGNGGLSYTNMYYPQVDILSTGNPLPDPVLLGKHGRIPPNKVVISKSETPVNLQDVPGVFNPDTDGIDFYESLEGMLVTVDDAVAISAIRSFGSYSSEFWVLPNKGNRWIVYPVKARTQRGGLNLVADADGYGDLNPERIQIQIDASDTGWGTLFPGNAPAVKLGDKLGDVTGVVGYDFGNFEIRATELFNVKPSKIKAERTNIRGSRQRVSVASYNVYNLSPLAADDDQRALLADHIAYNLRGPDVIALQEIQDNNGETDDGTTDATLTLQALVDAIAAAGGPNYDFFDVAPDDNLGGGVPGGNIRNAFLYNPDRVDLDSFVSLTPPVLTAVGADPAAFDGTRDPLSATFLFKGKQFTVVNNHLSSRYGSDPIFGGPQLFTQGGEAERAAQVQALNDYVDFLLDGDSRAKVIVLGDMNTFEFTDELAEILPGTIDGRKMLYNLLRRSRGDNRYTYIFDGNSQVLDHMFVTRTLYRKSRYDIVHVNADFPRMRNSVVGSDHEPILGLFKLK